jgi:hypothetical protein
MVRSLVDFAATNHNRGIAFHARYCESFTEANYSTPEPVSSRALLGDQIMQRKRRDQVFESKHNLECI